jgi:hypothetical protein
METLKSRGEQNLDGWVRTVTIVVPMMLTDVTLGCKPVAMIITNLKDLSGQVC